MSELDHLTPARRRTAEIIVRARAHLDAEERAVDAASMSEASAQFRDGKPLSRALLYQTDYRPLWDLDTSQTGSRKAARRAKRLAAENESLKATIAGLRLEATSSAERESGLKADLERLSAEVRMLEETKQDLLAGYVD